MKNHDKQTANLYMYRSQYNMNYGLYYCNTMFNDEYSL